MDVDPINADPMDVDQLNVDPINADPMDVDQVHIPNLQVSGKVAPEW